MLRGDKVVVRAVEREDLALLWTWWNDPGLWALLGGRRRLTSLDETEAWFEGELQKVEPSEGRTFAIADVAGGRLLGTVRYGPFDPADGHCEINVYIGDEADRHSGFGTAALRLLLSYLFEDLGLNKVHLLVHPENGAALDCYRALGFVREGLLRQHRFHGGRFHDFVYLGLLASDWEGEQDSAR